MNKKLIFISFFIIFANIVSRASKDIGLQKSMLVSKKATIKRNIITKKDNFKKPLFTYKNYTFIKNNSTSSLKNPSDASPILLSTIFSTFIIIGIILSLVIISVSMLSTKKLIGLSGEKNTTTTKCLQHPSSNYIEMKPSVSDSGDSLLHDQSNNDLLISQIDSPSSPKINDLAVIHSDYDNDVSHNTPIEYNDSDWQQHRLQEFSLRKESLLRTIESYKSAFLSFEQKFQSIHSSTDYFEVMDYRTSMYGFINHLCSGWCNDLCSELGGDIPRIEHECDFESIVTLNNEFYERMISNSTSSHYLFSVQMSAKHFKKCFENIMLIINTKISSIDNEIEGLPKNDFLNEIIELNFDKYYSDLENDSDSTWFIKDLLLAENT